MIDAGWKKEIGREPTIAELAEMQRIEATDPVRHAHRRIERIFVALLVVWAIAAFAGAWMLFRVGLPKQRDLLAFAGVFVAPLLANGWRIAALRRTTWREMRRQNHQRRLDAVNAAIAGT